MSEEDVSTDPDKILAVRNWSTPKTAKHVRSNLGLFSYYRRFVQDFQRLPDHCIGSERKATNSYGQMTVKSPS